MTTIRKKKLLSSISRLVDAERKDAVIKALSILDQIADESAIKEPRLGGVAHEMKQLTSKVRLAYGGYALPALLDGARTQFDESMRESIVKAYLSTPA